MSANQALLLPQVAPPLLLLLLLILAPGGSDACPKTLKRAFRSPKVKSLDEPACFTIESLRIESGTSGTSFDGLGAQLSVGTCQSYCRENAFTGKIIAMSDTQCHCNKMFKDYGQRDIAKCVRQCPGNSQERCGAPGYVSAYPV